MKISRSVRLLPLLLCMLFLLGACGGSSSDGAKSKQKSERRKPRRRPLLAPSSSGNPYEVMVVAEDSLWEGYAGAALRTVLNKPVPMLPQEEESFHTSRVEPKRFDRITHLFRNVIILQVNPHYSEPRIQVERDTYASPQLIMTIIGPTHAQLSAFITEQTKYLIKYFSTEEINREATRLETSHNIKFAKQVEEMFDCELHIPLDIKKMKVGDNFIWASDDGLSSIQNVCIYSYPYVSEKVFTRRAYIALRDSFMKRNIPGEHPGSHMATNSEFVTVEDMSIQGHYVQEARGFWEMTKEAMGGPFVAHSQVDTVNNRVIVVEGFVYAPDKKKRTMIRRLEAALYTLRLPEAEEDSDE